MIPGHPIPRRPRHRAGCLEVLALGALGIVLNLAALAGAVIVVVWILRWLEVIG